VLRFFRAIQLCGKDARLLVVNRNEQEFVRASIAHVGIDPEKVEVTCAEHHKMSGLIGRMDAGAALIKPVYSKIASAPTKLAEYLGCGVPCVGNINVGDMESILEGERVGVALRGFSPCDHREAASRLVALLEEPGIQERCARIARQLFSLDAGVEAYMSIYDKLAFDCVA
jgi:glycosyltransferase involved in cell wall biosynthesis